MSGIIYDFIVEPTRTERNVADSLNAVSFMQIV